MSAKLAGSLPGGDANGLGPILRVLVEAPHRRHIVIAVVDSKRTTVDNDSGEQVPTLRVRRIEVVRRDDLDAAERLVRRALEERTGQTVLPLEIEDDIRDLFESVRIDPDTGELIGGDDA